MPGNWSREEEADLLRALCAVKTISVTGKEWDAIASEMSTNHTGDACRQHFARIQKEFAGTTGSPKTPTTAGAPKRKAASTKDGETPTPSKPKRAKKAATVTPKKEESDDEKIKLEETDVPIDDYESNA